MRRLFANVPVIYGFASFAPVGPIAGPKLSRHFQSHSTRDVSGGRPSQALLAHFAANSMTVTSGMRTSEPHAAYAREVCQFVDERLPAAQKLRFVHGIMRRSVADARMFFDRI